MNSRIKTPSEKFPIWFNFSYDLAFNELLSSHYLTCVNEATGADSSSDIIDSDTLISPEVMVVLKGGVEGESHIINCRATTIAGNTYEREMAVSIQTVVTDTFQKQPGGEFFVGQKFHNRLDEVGEELGSAAITAIKESDGSSVAGTIVGAPYIIGRIVAYQVTGGVNEETYRIGIKGTTDVSGYVHEKTIRMIVREIR